MYVLGVGEMAAHLKCAFSNVTFEHYNLGALFLYAFSFLIILLNIHKDLRPSSISEKLSF